MSTMPAIITQGMKVPTQAEWDTADAIVADWKASAVSNRYRHDDGNVLLTLIALTLADRMNVAPAGLADRRKWIADGGSAVSADWDTLVTGVSRPDQKCQRRLMLAIAGRTSRVAIRLDWARTDDGRYWLVRTR